MVETAHCVKKDAFSKVFRQDATLCRKQICLSFGRPIKMSGTLDGACQQVLKCYQSNAFSLTGIRKTLCFCRACQNKIVKSVIYPLGYLHKNLCEVLRITYIMPPIFSPTCYSVCGNDGL